MSNHELFAKLSKNFEYIEDKIKEQETKITQNNTAMNNRIDLIDEKVSKKERQDQEKISELEQRFPSSRKIRKREKLKSLRGCKKKKKKKPTLTIPISRGKTDKSHSISTPGKMGIPK